MAKNVTPIQFLRSIVSGKRPIASRLLEGQPTVNTSYSDPGMYFADSTGTSLIKIGPCGVGDTPPNYGATPPSTVGNSKGELWMDTRSNAPVTAGNFITGLAYTIVTVGTTNFTLIGAASNTVGVNFVATGPGTGTGTASFTNITQTGPVLRVWDPTTASWLPCNPYAANGPTVVVNPESGGTPPDITQYLDNTLWWNSSNGLLSILYNDGTSRQWVQITSSVSPV
jgi:hypothetical protein